MAQPLNVVVINDHASVTGGAAKVALDGACGLKARGHRPIVFAAVGPVGKQLQEAGVEVVCLGQNDILSEPSRLRAASSGIWNFSAAAELSKVLGPLPKDRSLIHVHGWSKGLSASIASAIRASGLPTAYTLHDYFLFCPNGGLYNYQTNRVCEIEPMSAACLLQNCDPRSYPQKVWRYARHTTMRSFARLPDACSDFIVLSELQRSLAEGRLPIGAALHQAPNPVEAENRGPRGSAAKGDYVFAGRIAREKGPLLFAAAARRAGIIPVLIGDGPVRAELAERFPEARLLGWKSPQETRDLMRNARALVFPSLWYEGQPLAVLEAKAMGTPVIVSDVCAGRESVEDGVSGLWFKSGDPEALAGAMRRLDDDTLFSKLSDGGYSSYWANPPTLDKHVDALLQIYDGMLSRRLSSANSANISR